MNFLAALMESFLPAATEAVAGSGMSEAVASGGMAPPTAMESLGSSIGAMGNQAMAPTMEAYKTFTSPNATAGDMLSGVYKYVLRPHSKQEDEMMAPQQFSYGGGGMANNYMGGIPSLLQSYGGASQGLLPYIGSR